VIRIVIEIDETKRAKKIPAAVVQRGFAMMSDLLVIVFSKKIRYPSLGITRHDRTFV
jgi:hypothetical protein